MITIVGLGPAGAELLTVQAREVLEATDLLYLRTERHPAINDLAVTVRRQSFDHIYETAHDFESVYGAIAAEIVRLGRESDVVYAVPGHPNVGESTVSAIVAAAGEAGVPVRMIPGLSFVEPVLTALQIDALDGLQLYDALDIARYLHPPLDPDTPLVLGQVYGRLLANDLKLALMAVYPDGHQVALVHGAATVEEHVEWLPLYAIDRSEAINHLTSLYVPPITQPSSLYALAEAVAILRSPDGCPWDKEQTPQSLRAGFVEEASEVLEALDRDDPMALQEELGDLLLHIVMQTQMAREEELFRLSDVIAGIHAKIKRRHPHVWGEWHAEDAGEVIANWEAIKSQERAESGKLPQSLLDGVPPTLPALAQSQKIQKRVRRVGFDWPAIDGVIDKVKEEFAELEVAVEYEEQMAEMGDILFALVNWARWLKIDAEAALREANLRFSRRFRLLEQLAAQREIDLDDAGLALLESLWQEAKEKTADRERE